MLLDAGSIRGAQESLRGVHILYTEMVNCHICTDVSRQVTMFFDSRGDVLL